MAQRMMEVVFSAKNLEPLETFLKESERIIGYWKLELSVTPPVDQEPKRESEEEPKPEQRTVMVRILAPLEVTETLSDKLTGILSGDPLFRLTFFSVEATVPQPKSEEEDEEDEKEKEKEKEKQSTYKLRISREELYNSVSDDTNFNTLYVTTVILSVIVASIGLMKNDVAVIIGAMVIAPLLGPNVALSFAATLGDLKLGRRALKVNLFGLLIALAVSFLIGWVFQPDPSIDQISNRTEVNFGDIILSLAAGAAGVLAFTRGVAAGVIGVMVAVALLPPLVVSGLMAGAGHLSAATGALLLTMANVCGLNLSGILTFLVQGVEPRNWWEAKNARQATRHALLFWVLLLALFTAIILL